MSMVESWACPGVMASGLGLAQGILNILAISLLDEHLVAGSLI